MTPLRQHTGLAVPLWRPNVDTDQIIPKQFLKRIERTGFGAFLFNDWRFQSDGSDNPDFILNRPEFAGASILIAGNNFGCGSSREHAPWALMDYGFKVLVAPSYADIFYQNSLKNGLLPVRLPAQDVERLAERAQAGSFRLTVDVETLTIRDNDGWSAAFELDAFSQESLLEGLDDIGRTLAQADRIAEYEASHNR